uniref:NADH dehydrogenase subunit 5 n=1 Tax=Thalassoma jansenii TaxID=239046 RepID=UPI0023AA4DB0|nr:NADH dehydrogenase subunit 5 [Thalassoma jansenii]WCI20728.1 NADH dehydrogenase subunit 5 [Thalassoma jansenii]
MPQPLTPLSTLLLITLVLLASPVLARLSRTHLSPLEMAERIKTTVFVTFLISLVPLIAHLLGQPELSVQSWKCISTDSFTMTVSFILDFYTLAFIPVALFVTWSILQFSLYYMAHDLHIERFFMFLLVFLLAMMLLVSSNNMLQLFVGWEGVGMMSFLLIGWWHARADASTAALQAVAYNRVGDIGMLFSMAYALGHVTSWQISEIVEALDGQNPTPFLVGLIIAAAGKSAQFGLHPWLPAAMEGPTPVSSLLHSSTMVVAGVFLLIRFHKLIDQCPLAATLCLCLGAITSFYAAFCALTQNDIKKIIAFSTSSQLGLMMVTVGVGQAQLAFLHICTHAFFKAMLFICAGSIIHCLNDEQDIRKMGGMHRMAPFTCGCLTLGSLALTGTPFLSGFFSKDAILEAMTASTLNAWALMLTFVATGMTAAYSGRILCYVILGQPRVNPQLPINENHPHVINPLKRLAWGSMTAGFLLFLYILPEKTPVMTMPAYLKGLAMFVTIIGFMIVVELAVNAAKQVKRIPNQFMLRLSAMLVFFGMIVHRGIPQMSLMAGQKFAAQSVDQNWLEKVGPQTVNSANKPMISTMSNLQRGRIITHLAMYVLTLTLAVILGFS